METAKLTRVKDCKHSIRFDNEDQKAKVVTSVYLLRPAHEALGEPDEIEVSVTAAA